MKKLFSLFFLFAITMIAVNAQTNLFKGITSGMSESELISHCQNHEDFTKSSYPDLFFTEIGGRTYIVSSYFNKTNELNFISFSSMDSYEWFDYDPNVKENAEELFTLLSVKYGDPIFNKWISWTEIPDGKLKGVCTFKKETISSFIYVEENSGKYSIRLIVADKNFDDPEKPADSGGF
jgi:hypothetical protein